MAQNEFVRQTQLFRKNAKLSLGIEPSADNFSDEPDFLTGEYDLPDDCLDIVSVQWNGIPLDKKGIAYLETAYTGTSNHSEIRGDGRLMDESWRDSKGTPIHWTYDNKRIRMFPLIEEHPLVNTIDTSLESTDVRFPVAIVRGTASDYVVLLRIYGTTTENDVTYSKASMFMKLHASTDYSFEKDSDQQMYLTLTESILTRIRSWLNSGWSIGIYTYTKSASAKADYVYKPYFIIDNPDDYSDVESVHIEVDEQWHEAVASYAAYLALSKEGDKTQDLQKAQIYLARFSDMVKQAKNLTDAEIDIDPMVLLPFRI